MRVLTIKIDIFTTTQSLPNKWQLASPHPGLPQPTAHCIIVTFNSAAGYDKNKKGIEHKDAKS